MMYPVLAKVRYERIRDVTRDKRLLLTALVLNWVIAPAVMFGLAWAFLADQPAYRTGLIIVGLAPCIAMVLIWNDLAGGDREACALLVALNSLIQIAAYSLLAYFYLQLLPGWLGLNTNNLHVSLWEIARMVLIFLGVPLTAGYLTRRTAIARRGEQWYTTRFLPRVSPLALWGLLFTVVVLFALQGHKITSQPFDVARITVPLLVYFAVMWVAAFTIGVRLRLPYAQTATLAFTAASNNFELAIAVAIGVFGVTSGQALAGVVGPLIEVPDPRRARLGRPPLPPPLLPPGGHTVNCYDCATQDRLAQPAVAVCHDCGAAVCDHHAITRAHHLTRPAVILREEPVDPPARTIRCSTCDAAWAAQHHQTPAETGLRR